MKRMIFAVLLAVASTAAVAGNDESLFSLMASASEHSSYFGTGGVFGKSKGSNTVGAKLFAGVAVADDVSVEATVLADGDSLKPTRADGYLSAVFTKRSPFQSVQGVGVRGIDSLFFKVGGGTVGGVVGAGLITPITSSLSMPPLWLRGELEHFTRLADHAANVMSVSIIASF